MYNLYYRLMNYMIWNYVAILAITSFKLLVIWLIFDEYMISDTFYGKHTYAWKYTALFYLPEPQFDSINFDILVKFFFVLANLGILLGFSLIMVVMETDLGCVYRNREASEISLFTLT